MKKLTAILLIAALLPATSLARFIDGNKLLDDCEGGNVACSGYIAGISDAHGTFVGWGDMGPKFCVPKGVTVGQLMKVAVKHLNDFPEALHYNASGLVSQALFGAFPPSFKDDGTRYCPDEGES